MAMELERLAASKAELGEISDRVARVVDSYVMAVTERLCALENRDRDATERSEFVERKARILESLDVLDRLVAAFRHDFEGERACCAPPRRRAG